MWPVRLLRGFWLKPLRRIQAFVVGHDSMCRRRGHVQADTKTTALALTISVKTLAAAAQGGVRRAGITPDYRKRKATPTRGSDGSERTARYWASVIRMLGLGCQA